MIEMENKEFTKIISTNARENNKIIKFFNVLLESKNNSTNTIKKYICEDKLNCLNYLDSDFNIFNSGVDFTFKSCITQINNIFLDYKKLNNKTDIKEINSKIFDSGRTQFILIGLSLTNVFMYVKEKIYDCFETDVINFNYSSIKFMKYLNLSSIIFAIFTFIFVIVFIFISISRYTNPIKISSYRINCSFYFIKKYSLTKTGK